METPIVKGVVEAAVALHDPVGHVKLIVILVVVAADFVDREEKLADAGEKGRVRGGVVVIPLVRIPMIRDIPGMENKRDRRNDPEAQGHLGAA
jgi:hypothetical protein